MENCLYCGNPYTKKVTKQIFCSDKCRVYFGRQQNCEGGIVYCLKNPLEGNSVFYIGKTIFTASKRLTEHISGAKGKGSKGKKNETIKTILEAGETVIIEQIEIISNESITETEKILRERETFWIKKFAEKQQLTNAAHNSTRTNPIGVRFDPEVLEHLKVTFGIPTAQAAANFFSEMYRKENMQPKKSVREKIILPKKIFENITYAETTPEAFEGKNVPMAPLDEVGQMPQQPAVTEIPPMPTRDPGEDAFAFAYRKNEWKRLYGQGK